MREMAWIPGWIGEWADRNPNFRNMPVFAALSAQLFFVFSSFRLQTANCHLPTSPQVPSPVVRGPVVLRRAALCFCAAAVLGGLLEAFQLFLPHRWADWRDVFWSVAGALAGALVALIIACFVDLEA